MTTSIGDNMTCCNRIPVTTPCSQPLCAGLRR